MMKNTTAILLILCLLTTYGYSQIGLPDFDQKGNVSCKSLLKQAREKNTIGLAILYTEDAPVSVLPRITQADSIKQLYNLVTDVVNPYRQISYSLINRARPFSNPKWITVHPDNIIIGASSKIVSNEELDLFVRTSKQIAADYENAKDALELDKDNVEAQKRMISVMSNMFESNQVRRTLNKYLKTIENPTDEDLNYVISIAEKCACSSKLEDFIEDREERVIDKIGLQRYLSIKQRFINADLTEKRLLEPYYVWQKYEQELGVYADSLYRLFAIEYFDNIPGEQEAMVNESIDFLTYYPDSPWEVQEKLYAAVLPNIKTKEDHELMLDLISGQIFKEKTFLKLDIRAWLLYKLGKKEQALAMVGEISALAAEQGIRYKSMLTSLR